MKKNTPSNVTQKSLATEKYGIRDAFATTTTTPSVCLVIFLSSKSPSNSLQGPPCLNKKKKYLNKAKIKKKAPSMSK
jgi:hypothetical protein